MPAIRFKMERVGNMISIYIFFVDGSYKQIGVYEVPNDKNWRADVDFYDGLMDVYKKRYNKMY